MIINRDHLSSYLSVQEAIIKKSDYIGYKQLLVSVKKYWYQLKKSSVSVLGKKNSLALGFYSDVKFLLIASWTDR